MVAPKDEQTKGFLLVLLSTLAYGAMPIFGKVAYAEGAQAASLLAWRFAIATLVFALTASPKAKGLAFKDRLRLWGIGIVFVVNALFYFMGLERVPASTASVLVYTYPVIVTVLSGLLGFDRFTVRELLAAIMAFAGCALTAGAVEGGGTGVWLVLISAFLYSIFMLLGSRFAAHLPAEATASHTAQAAAVFCIPFAVVQGTLWYPATPRAWGAVIAIAAVCTVVALRTLLSGMARIGAVKAAVLSSMEVVITMALAAALLGETLGPRQIAGAALILGAVVFQNLATLRRLAARSGPAREELPQDPPPAV